MTAIPVKQRDDFSAWLRKQGVTRICSHEVARDPGKRWTFIRGGDGYIRAFNEPVALKNWRRFRDRYTAGTVEVFHVRWKVDPQPGPNSWEQRSPIRPHVGVENVRCSYLDIFVGSEDFLR